MVVVCNSITKKSTREERPVTRDNKIMIMIMLMMVGVQFTKQLDSMLVQVLSFDVMLIHMLLVNQVTGSDIGQVYFTLLFPHCK